MKLPIYTPESPADAVTLVLAQGLALDESVKRSAVSKGGLTLKRCLGMQF